MRRFAWLAAALLVAVAMLMYLQTRMAIEGHAPEVPQGSFANPTGDREALVSGLFQGALLSAPDGEDFAETPNYRRLLFHVKSMPAADFSSRVAGWLDWQAAVEDPARWRGEFVRVRGIVAKLSAVKLRGQDASIEDVYRGFISETDGSEPVVFDLVDRPPDVHVSTAVKDTLDIEGVFYRTVRFESRDGQFRDVPYIIARTLTVQRAAKSQPPMVVALEVLAVVAVSVAIGLAIVRWGGRSKRTPRGPAQAGFREMFEARLRDGPDRPRNGPKPS